MLARLLPYFPLTFVNLVAVVVTVVVDVGDDFVVIVVVVEVAVRLAEV